MSRNAEVPVFNQIEQVRTARGLSRQDLADLVGVHYQTIGYLERGMVIWTVAIAWLFVALGISIDSF